MSIELLVSEIRVKCKKLKNIDESLLGFPKNIYTERMHEIGVSLQNEYIEVVELCSRIAEISVPSWSLEELRDIQSKLNTLVQYFKNIEGIRNNIPKTPLKGLEDLESNLADMVIQIGINIRRLNQKLDTKEGAKKIEEAIFQAEKISEKSEKVDKIVEALEEISGEKGISEFSVYFASQSKTLNRIAIGWLIITILLAIATFYSVNNYLQTIPTIYSATTAIIYVSTRILYISFLLAVTLWCGKNFKILMHQVTINRFKATTLNAYKLLSEGANNPTIRDAILLEAVRAIFSESSTGYIRDSDEKNYKSADIMGQLQKIINLSNKS